MATFHDDLAALTKEYEEKGYFYLSSRGTAGPLGVLRYNLEEMPEFAVAAAWAPDRPRAAALADIALAAGPPDPVPALHTGRFAGRPRCPARLRRLEHRLGRQQRTALHGAEPELGGPEVWAAGGSGSTTSPITG